MGSRWGCCSGLLSVDSLLWREQSCPSSLSPALLFSQCLSGTRKTEPARTKVLCSPLAWAFKPAKITQNHSEKRRGLTSQGQLRGEETNPRLLSGVPRGPRDLACLYIGGQLTTAMVSWLRGRVTPGGGSGHCVSLTPSAWVRIMCAGRPQTKLRKKDKWWELRLCLGINALQYSLYTGLSLFASLPSAKFTLPGAPGGSSGVYLIIIPIFQHIQVE